MPRAPHSGMFLQHGAAEPSREEPSSPARAPGVRQLADTFHLDARVHKKELARRPTPGDLQHCGVISYNIKKWLRHFMKNLRFFVNSCPSDNGLSYMDSGVKSPGCGARLAYCTKNVRATDFCAMEVRLINRGSLC